ncbi:TetR/AcrR family transcriptional regulator [Clostridium sardiniense]|uniref:TetR/AcrR family transcriptional regulator n=1 Tax=Clostridium sardiniense TaxID=29369 RepID=UPI003D34AE6F
MPKILENPKEKILSEARFMIKEDGYSKLSMRNLAQSCGIGLGTVYNYFKNKHSIVLEIIRGDWKEVILKLKDVNKLDKGFEEKMKIIYDAVDNYFSNHMGIFFEVYKEEKSKPNHNIDSIFGPLYDITEEIIVYHINNGDIQSALNERVLSKFIVSNMITIIKSRTFSFEDLICILTSKYSN